MSPRGRQLLLTTHVLLSVGWLGAVAAFLALSLAGLTSVDAQVMRGAYIAMDLVGRYVIVPLSLASLLSGVVQALATPWGLFKHYWVLAKLVLTVLSTLLLLLHQFTAVATAAERVMRAALDSSPRDEVGRLGTQLVLDAGLALVVLTGITALSVFKPWGRTPWERGPPDGDAPDPGARPGAPFKVAVIAAGVLVAILVLKHLLGGPHHH